MKTSFVNICSLDIFKEKLFYLVIK